MTKNKERGSEAAMRKREITLRRWEQMPGPSSQAENKKMTTDMMMMTTKITTMMMVTTKITQILMMMMMIALIFWQMFPCRARGCGGAVKFFNISSPPTI